MAIELNRVGWENGTLVSSAKVNVGGTIYDVTPEQYSGSTPVSAENLKAMEDNTEDAINELVPVILYNNTEGSNSTITLSDSAGNYSRFKIYYFETRNNGYNSVEVIAPNNKNVILTGHYYGATALNIYLNFAEVNINGTNVTWNYNNRIRINDQQLDTDHLIKIVKIVGYNY